VAAISCICKASITIVCRSARTATRDKHCAFRSPQSSSLFSAVASAQSPSSYCEPKYPARWWTPITKEGAPEWKIEIAKRIAVAEAERLAANQIGATTRERRRRDSRNRLAAVRTVQALCAQEDEQARLDEG
jgi:uncharacterized membrane protein YqiK